MFCKYCGKEIANDSNFCQFCGEKLNDNIIKKTESQINKTRNLKSWIANNKIIFYSLSSAIIVVITFFVLRNNTVYGTWYYNDEECNKEITIHLDGTWDITTRTHERHGTYRYIGPSTKYEHGKWKRLRYSLVLNETGETVNLHKRWFKGSLLHHHYYSDDFYERKLF